ncbi:MAG TPA: PqiC family protein [Rhodopila sp.]|nr:PqiC family protein [Rhodopila sp.]
MLSTAATALVAACTSPNPRLYTLGPMPGTPRTGGPGIVLLHQIAVARYLERPEIVRSSENYRLDIMANDAWGEPLAAMIARVLAEDLSQRLPGTTVVNAAGAITAPEDAAVEVNIQRMDMDATRALVLVAQAAVTFAKPSGSQKTRAFRTAVPLTSTLINEEVQAMSIALGRLADEIALMLHQLPAPRRHRR